MKKVRFYSNKDLDKFMALQFLDEKAAGVDFGKRIIELHPNLEITKEMDERQKKIVINKYFDDYYKKNKKSLQSRLLLFKEAWRKKEKDFFKVSESLFNNFSFQEGMYIAYLSIIDCNPRFLESKTFQVFYKKEINDVIYTIAHELLHFIFFDFLNQKLKKESKVLSEEKIWDLSEIFNVIILKSDLFKGIIDKKAAKPYPDHKKYIDSFEKAYKKSTDTKDFILRGIEILKKPGEVS